jgi:proteasome lid subunit RPN8/RPN11
MFLPIDASISDVIMQHARSAYPSECCGAVLGHVEATSGDRQGVAAIALENESPFPRTRHFFISSRQHLECERLATARGLEIIGFYHSHPEHEAIPSATDRALAWPWYYYFIVAVSTDAVGPIRAWTLLDDQSAFTELQLSIAEVPSQ